MAGSKEHNWLEFKCPSTGEPIHFPVGRLYGAATGPTLVVVAGVHGSEYAGIEAAIRLYHEVDPADLRGTVIIGLIYNLPAFVGHAAFVVPVDGKDPGGSFPGTLGGTYSDAMAYYFTQEVIRRADYLVELHGGDVPEALFPYLALPVTDRADVDARSQAMALVYNIPIISRRHVCRPNHPHAHAAYAVAALRGAPAILCEAGQQGILDPAEAQIHLTGLRNVLVHLGMLSGQVVKTVKPRFCDEIWPTHSPIDGMWRPAIRVGEAVRQGQLLGSFSNYFGDDRSEVRATVDGVVTVLRTSADVRVGSTVVGVMVLEEGPGTEGWGTD